MEHPIILTLKQRRANRSGDTGVLWKELDLIIQLTEVLMEGISQTEAALANLKKDSEDRDKATQAALTDLKAEVAKLEAANPGIDTTSINQTIAGLDAAVKTGTSEAQAADPGGEAPSSPQPTLEGVQVSIGENGEGTALVNQPFTQAGVSTQPTSGTAVLEAVEGQPSQLTVKVTGATPNSTQTVEIAVVAAA